MFLLDTNIISEMMKSTPNIHVLHWLDSYESHDLFISTITIAEISFGISILASGNRRKTLETMFQKTMMQAFEYRILAFDQSAANAYGCMMARRKQLGKPMSILDGQIAATAQTQELTIVTRNVRAFEECGLDIVNPFEQTLKS